MAHNLTDESEPEDDKLLSSQISMTQVLATVK